MSDVELSVLEGLAPCGCYHPQGENCEDDNILAEQSPHRTYKSIWRAI